MKKLSLLFIFSSLLYCGHAAIKLPRLISKGMILQRDVPLKIWGWADAGEKVNVNFSAYRGKTFSTQASEKGEWLLTLPPHTSGGPFVMTLTGTNKIVLEDILFGDVWVCSGQSNMELAFDRLKYKYADEVAGVNNNSIRQFLVPDKYDFNQPAQDLTAGDWHSANAKNIFSFSGVAYFFAKEIYAKYKIPIGLINAALGGSPAEAWISEDGLKKFPQYYDEAKKFRDNALINEIEARDQAKSNAWYKLLHEKDLGLQAHWKSNEFVDSGWADMIVPGYWADQGFNASNGVFWFRKVISVPASMVGKPAKIELGRIVDADSVFINERFVGNTTYQYPPRRYEIASGILKEGKNIVVIRVVNNSGRGGFVPDKHYELTTLHDTMSLAGQWKFKQGATMPAAPGQTFIRWKPLGLYNAMIAPLQRYAIKGVLWYQGESNAGKPENYKELMQTLIEDWRNKWSLPGKPFPFLYVQLPNYMEPKKIPAESSWAVMRQQQLNTLSVPNTAMAIAIDAGEWNDIHPEDKKTVGHRLALLARKNVYKETKLVASGPLYHSMKVIGKKIVVRFTNIGSGLAVKEDSALRYFAIAGADKQFVWAQAKIEGNTVEVWSESINKPMYVRYAWADNPEGANLINREGLPASPFTTEK